MYILEQQREQQSILFQLLYVDRYNAEKDAWGQIAGWSKDAENDYFVSTSKYITVEPDITTGYAQSISQVCSIHMRVLFLYRRNYDQIANNLPFIIP